MSNCFFSNSACHLSTPASSSLLPPFSTYKVIAWELTERIQHFLYYFVLQISDQNNMELKTTALYYFFFLIKITWNWKQPVFLLQLQYCCSHNPGFNLLFFLSIHLYYFFFLPENMVYLCTSQILQYSSVGPACIAPKDHWDLDAGDCWYKITSFLVSKIFC